MHPFEHRGRLEYGKFRSDLEEGFMKRKIALIALVYAALLASCAKKDSTEAAKPAPEAPAAAASQPPPGGPHAFVHLKDGSKVPGSIVASTQTDMVVAGDDGIERKIPLAQVKSVEYGDAPAPPQQAARETAPGKKTMLERPAPAREARQTAGTNAPPPAQPQAGAAAPAAQPPAEPPAAPAAAPLTPPPPPAVTTKTYELAAGSEVSVRTNEAIDSSTAAEGQTFDVQVTRDAKDANGDVVIPRGSGAKVVIKSASKGGRFRGASDLVLDLQSVAVQGKQYSLDTADITQKGKSGVGVNKRTAEYAGGGAAIGAIIGAIAGGGKGAAIGAGAGAGAGAITQILTKGGAIKVPAESVLTFQLDKPLKVTAAQ
jgi:hypothetical protein